MDINKTDDKPTAKGDQKPKKRSIMDNPKQRYLFEKMGMVLQVQKPTDDTKQ